MTIDTLQNLIDIDIKDHKLKAIAELFVSAMTDWPTFNQTEISEFANELKNYFGTPLTIEKIIKIKYDGHNAWQGESGCSIIEMLKIADKFYNKQSFDQILQNIISYYEQELKNVDFVADLKFLTIQEGGRTTPAFSGYRPQVKFTFAEIQTSGQQKFLDKETAYPGDKVKAAIKIISVDYFAHSLTEGMAFDFREGSNIIGTGTITTIFNDNLKKACR